MGKANKLSKRLDWKVGVEKDNENQTLIKEKWIHSLVEVVIEGSKCYNSKILELINERNLV